MTDLDALRNRIDELDRQLLDILVHRASAAREIGEVKGTIGTPAMDPGRERLVLERLHAVNDGRFPPAALTAIFREIISASRALEAAIVVGYLGRPGSFAQVATARRFGSSARVTGYPDPERLIRDLGAGVLEFAVIGRDVGEEDPALDSFDLLLESRVTLFGEAIVEQGYALVGFGAAPRALYAHPVALVRCRGILDRFPESTAVATAGSHEALQSAVEAGEAALAPAAFASERGLHVLDPHAEDETEPIRRYLVLSRTPPARSGDDRTAMVCVLPNRPGILVAVLERMARESVNLAWIEARQSRHRPWEHTFFLEVDGHLEDPAVSRAVEAVQDLASHLQVLGSYPRELRAPAT